MVEDAPQRSLIVAGAALTEVDRRRASGGECVPDRQNSCHHQRLALVLRCASPQSCDGRSQGEKGTTNTKRRIPGNAVRLIRGLAVRGKRQDADPMPRGQLLDGPIETRTGENTIEDRKST